MKCWLRDVGPATFQVFHALIWAVAIVLIDRINDWSGGGGSYTLWLAVCCLLVNGAITAVVFGKPETEK
jgi:hypothetical protein